MEHRNLLAETTEVLAEHGKAPSDVTFVVTAKATGSWTDFARFADFDYDAGYGGAMVNTSLKIVGADWWLERGEYDGSEWWEFKCLPVRSELSPLREDDLKDRW